MNTTFWHIEDVPELGGKEYQIFDTRKEAKEFADKKGGVVYTWQNEGIWNLLVKRFTIVNVLCYLVLEEGLPDEIELPDDEDEWLDEEDEESSECVVCSRVYPRNEMVVREDGTYCKDCE